LVLHTIDVIQIMLNGVSGVRGGGKMPERERPDRADRDRSLAWRILAREKFFEGGSGLRLVHLTKDKDTPGRASGDPREDDDGRPDPGRG
jgi:hypothetical protein